jgi:uncharacterized protein YoxC
MLNAVWVAVIVAVAFWVVVACMAVYVMVKAARLISQANDTVTSLRERGDVLMERANTVTRRASDQVAKTAAITASMEEVTSTMAELGARLTALTPMARTIIDGAGAPVARVAALVFGVNRAFGLRRGGRARLTAQAVPVKPARRLGRRRALAPPDRSSQGRKALNARRRPALTGQRNGGAR